jgi:Zn-dependent protease with chaperone function
MDTTNVSVDYRDFIHPEDETAMRRLKTVPGLQTITKWLLDIGSESLFHGLYMAQGIRLSPTQLPHLYNHLPPICQKFGIAEPEFYLVTGPPNACTLGDTRTFLVITSGLLSYVKNDKELVAILAHECGHILCRHVLYKTMAYMLAGTTGTLGVLGKLAVPVQLALNYWSRRSELSADRAELVYLGDSAPVLGALARLAGGPAEITNNINFEEFAAQAEGYVDLQKNSKWHKILQTLAIMDSTHPFSAVRVHEIMKWEKSEQYQRLRAVLNREDRRQCSHCGQVIEIQSKFCRYCGSELN